MSKQVLAIAFVEQARAVVAASAAQKRDFIFSRMLILTIGNLEKSRISHLQKLTKNRLAAPKGLINCTSK